MLSGINSRRIEHRNRQRRIKTYAITIGVTVGVLVAAYLIFRSPLFMITEFVVESSRPIDTERLISTLKTQVAGTRLGSIFGVNHSFAWNRELHYDAPEFSGISINKKLFDKTIRIKTIPRERFAVWCRSLQTGVTDPETGEAITAPTCYWIDETGIAYEPALETSGQLIAAVYEQKITSVLAAGEPVVSAGTFSNVKKILTALPALNIGVKQITIDRDVDELHVATHNGTRIQFSLRFDPQVTALPALNRIIEKPGLRTLEYVNLSVENRVFYKPK